MASNTFTGSYAVYMGIGTTTGRYAFTTSEIDGIYTGTVPGTTSTVSYEWQRIFTSADDSASIEFAADTLMLKTQEEGLRSIYVTQPDSVSMTIPVADVQLDTFKILMQLNPDFYSSSGTVMPLNFNQVGENLMANARPFLIVHKAYAPTTNLNHPPATDPMAFVFVKGGVAERRIAFDYSPGSQQVFNVKLAFMNSSGSTYDNVGGCCGDFTFTT